MCGILLVEGNRARRGASTKGDGEMKTCACGKEETTLAVGYRKDRLNVRPVLIHVEDAARYDGKPLFLYIQQTKDYVKKADGTRYGFNIAREIVGLDPGHQGMTSEEEIVVYLNGNTLDLRRCNLRVQLASDTRPARIIEPVAPTGEYKIHGTITGRITRNSATELWNREATNA